MSTRPIEASALALLAACLALADCSSDRFANGEPASTGSVEPLAAAPAGRISSAPLPAPAGSGAAGASPAAPGTDMAGRWRLSSTAGQRCGVIFTPAGTGSGSIAPEAGCPGKFYTSRSFVLDPGGTLIIRDHTGAPLAQLAQSTPGRFEGRTSDGQQLTLER